MGETAPDLSLEQLSDVTQRRDISIASGNWQKGKESEDTHSDQSVRLPSEQAHHAKIVEKGQKLTMTASAILQEGPMQICPKYNLPREPDSKVRGAVTDHVRIGLALEAVPFKSQEICVIEMLVPPKLSDHDKAMGKNLQMSNSRCFSRYS